MDIKEIERVVASVQQTIFRNANSNAVGAMRSRFKGAGLQFREHQIYAPGDDVRFIDWKLSARTGHVYVKTFEEDRNVEISVFIDVTASSFYGSQGVSKLQMALEITGLLYILAGQTHDLVRVFMFWSGDKIELTPKRGREGLVQFISMLERREFLAPGGKTNLRKAQGLETGKPSQLAPALRQQLSRGKEVVYLGDMLTFPTDSEIAKLVGDRHFHAVRLLSPLDLKALSFTFATSRGSFAGLGKPKSLTDFRQRFPIITSDERYLESFLRRIR